jgi:hypothetical protein
VATFQDLLTRSFAGGNLHATFDGRVYLSDSTRTPERLIRDILAWLAQATMAVITASVFTTGELLRADNHAEMLTL